MKWKKKKKKKCYYNLNVEFYVQILYREIDLGVTNNDFTNKRAQRALERSPETESF